MENVFTYKLYTYLVDNNPDVLIQLQQEGKLTQFLEDKVNAIDETLTALAKKGKPAYIIEQVCLLEMTREFRPSKYYYLRLVLEEEFEEIYLRLSKTGILTYEILNLLEVCKPIFDMNKFSEQTEGNRHLRYEIMGMIYEYFEGQR
jgi:hypothetical protein